MEYQGTDIIRRLGRKRVIGVVARLSGHGVTVKDLDGKWHTIPTKLAVPADRRQIEDFYKPTVPQDRDIQEQLYRQCEVRATWDDREAARRARLCRTIDERCDDNEQPY